MRTTFLMAAGLTSALNFAGSDAARAEISYTKLKNVNKLIDPKFEYLSPVQGFTFYKQGTLRNFRLYGNYGEYRGNTIPCLEEAPSINRALRDNKDCPLDYTSALIQQLFPNQNPHDLAPNQLSTSPVSQFSFSLIGKLLARISYFDLTQWKNYSAGNLNHELSDLLLSELNPQLYWQTKLQETDASLKQKLYVKAPLTEITPLKTRLLGIKAYLSRSSAANPNGWKPKDLKPFIDSLVGALLESRKAPSYYTLHTPEQLLLAFFWAKANDKRDILTLVQELPKYTWSSYAQSVFKNKSDRSEFLEQTYTTRDYQEWISKINTSNTADAFGKLLRNSEQASFLGYAYELYENKLPPLVNGGSAKEAAYTDCGETSVRNFFNFALYDPRARAFNLSFFQSLQEAHSGLKIKDTLFDYYRKYAGISTLNSPAAMDDWNGLARTKCQGTARLSHVLNMMGSLLFSNDTSFSGISKSEKLNRISTALSRPGFQLEWSLKNYQKAVVNRYESGLEIEFKINKEPGFSWKIDPNRFSTIDETLEKSGWRIAVEESLANEINKNPNTYLTYQFSSALPWYTKEKYFDSLSRPLIANEKQNQVTRMIFGLPLQTDESRLFAIEKMFEYYPGNSEPFYTTITHRLMTHLHDDGVYSRTRILNSALKNQAVLRDEINSQYFAKFNSPELQRNSVIAALTYGYLYVLKELERRQIPIDLKDDYKNTPMHVAAINGKWEVVEYLADRKSGDIVVKNSNGNTPLQITALSGKWDVVRMLAGKNPNAIGIKGGFGETPVHLACSSGKWDAALDLSGKNTNSLIIKNDIGNTPLHIAAANDKWEIVHSFAEQNPSSLAVTNDAGSTPIYLAAAAEKWDMVKSLAELYPKAIPLKNAEGNTVQHEAVTKKNLDIVQFLAGLSPESLLVKNAAGETPLLLAVSSERWKIARFLGEECPRCVAEKDVTGNTALHEAVTKGKLDMVQFLAGRNFESTAAVNKEGYTPLHEAAAKGNEDIIDFLVGKNFDAIYMKDIFGETPILVAATHRNWGSVKLLIQDMKEHPEKILGKNRSEQSLLDLVRAADQTDLEVLLKSIGVEE